MEFQRLKDKLGTRSLPSSEVEFRGAAARLLGEEGRGVATIIEMVTHTRLDCVIGSAAGMRRGVAEAIWHARHRSAFGAPAGRAAADAQRARRPRDRVRGGDRDRAAARARLRRGATTALRRFATAVLKYWICKRATPHAVEALECLGGNGYVEESPMPRLLRDAPLNGIWEGSGNVMRLDVLRALAREPEGLPAFLAECELARGADAPARRPPRRAARDAAELAATTRSGSRAARSRTSRSPSRPRCSCASRRPRSPTRSAPAASASARGRVFGTLPRGRRRCRDRRAGAGA